MRSTTRSSLLCTEPRAAMTSCRPVRISRAEAAADAGMGERYQMERRRVTRREITVDRHNTMCHTVCDTQDVTSSMPIDDDLFEKLRIELRRGALGLAVLAALREERYGYTLRQMLDAAGLKIDEGALYPLLRRLESQGLLTSE